MEDLHLTPEHVSIHEAALQSMDGAAGLSPPARARAFARDGLLGVLAGEQRGGLGLDLLHAAVVCQAAGHKLVPFPLEETLVAASLGDAMDNELCESIVAGETLVTMAWQGRLTARALRGGWVMGGSLDHVCMAREAHWLLAPFAAADDGGSCGIAAIDLRKNTAQFADGGLDLERPRARVLLSNAEVPSAFALPCSEEHLQSLQAQGQLLRAADMLGAAEAAHAAAYAYVNVREQFGRTLAANQSVSHLLARSHITLAHLRLSLRHAAITRTQDTQQRDLAHWIAWAGAGEQARQVAQTALHLHGAMGYTWDLPLHRWLRRIQANQAAAPARDSREQIASMLLD